MKTFTLFTLCLILSAGIAFAENPPDDTQKNDTDNNIANKSKYKASPRLNYHNDKSAEDDKGLGSLKPMLNQVMENNQKNSNGGAVIPNGGTYNF
jgi:hypothetical protein